MIMSDLRAVPSVWDGPAVAAMLADFLDLVAIAREVDGEGILYRDYLMLRTEEIIEEVAPCCNPDPRD